MKRNLVLFLSCLFCFGCATNNVVNRGSNYTENTKVFSYLGEGKVDNYREKGNYDEYFSIVRDTTPNYQLVYHHPGDYSADTYSYYIALARFSNKNENLQASATYNGKILPVAVNYAKGASTLNYVNVLLTREQLIDAYENVGKMVIPLVVDGNKYNLVFPDYYLRKVLAQTTNIEKYKIAEHLANPPVSERNTKDFRNSFEYSTNVEAPNYITLYPNKGKEERITADLKINNPNNKFYFTITYILQHADKDKNLSENHQNEITYVKSYIIREREVYDDYCYQLRTRFDTTYQKLTIQCQRSQYGAYTSIASFNLYANPKPTDLECSKCSVVKHI